MTPGARWGEISGFVRSTSGKRRANMASGRLAVIGGGNMGEALAKGVVNARYAAREALLIAEPVKARARYLRETHGFEVVSSAAEAAAQAGKVVFAVKPQVLGAVLA